MEDETLPRYPFKTHLLVILVILGVAVGGFFGYRVSSQEPRVSANVDMMEYYPNFSLTDTHYLEGLNNVSGKNVRNVLWFETDFVGNKLEYKMYNSAPDDPIYRICHWDQLSWNLDSEDRNSSDGELVYAATHDECDVSQQKPLTDIVFTPAITFMPKKWSTKKNWVVEDVSQATYSENGVVVCEGTNTYKNELLDYDVTDKKRIYVEIHWRTNQTIEWTSGTGSSFSGCKPGETTQWQEDYYFTNDMKLNTGQIVKGLKRTVGGNTEVDFPNWDITFTEWAPLPK